MDQDNSTGKWSGWSTCFQKSYLTAFAPTEKSMYRYIFLKYDSINIFLSDLLLNKSVGDKNWEEF